MVTDKFEHFVRIESIALVGHLCVAADHYYQQTCPRRWSLLQKHKNSLQYRVRIQRPHRTKLEQFLEIVENDAARSRHVRPFEDL
jgi:hypothetical protein